MKYFIITILILSTLSFPASAISENINSPESQPVEDLLNDLPDKKVQNKKLEGLSIKIALDLKNMDILEVLKFLSAKGKLNITASNDVTGRVTLFMTDITIKDALDIIMFNNNLAYMVKEGVIFIMTNTTYKNLHGKSFNENKIKKVVKFTNSSGNDLTAILGEIKSPQGKVIINAATKTLILIDSPEIVSEMERTVKKIDEYSFVKQKVFRLKYAKVEDLQATVQEALTPEVGKLKIDKRTNSMIITDLPSKFKSIKDIIMAFDTRPKQVLIETKIVQVRLDKNFTMGVNWQNLLASARNLNFVGSFPVSSSLVGSQEVSVGTIPSTDFEATLTLLQTVGETNILSTPRITTISNKEAKILVGSREAYITQTTSQSDVSTTTAESIEFIDVGVKLYVTPIVSDDGYITLNIKPEVSNVTSTLESKQGSTVPIINTTEAETNVVIKSGATIIIAGLIKKENTDEFRKVPLLGNIPLLGALFRSTGESSSKTELVLFLTPTIVDGEGDIKKPKIKKSKPLKKETKKGDKPSKPKK